jgi:hypothetical protein
MSIQLVLKYAPRLQTPLPEKAKDKYHILVDVLLATVMTGIGSGVIGAVLGMGKK